MENSITQKHDRKFFALDRQAARIAVIVNIRKIDDEYFAMPSYPRLQFCVGVGNSPDMALAEWHKKHCTYIRRIVGIN